MKADPRYFRPAAADVPEGDASKAEVTLGWRPRVGFEELVRMMVDADVELARKEAAAGAVQPLTTRRVED